MGSTLNEYNVSFEKNETNMKVEQIKTLALVKGFKMMKQKCKVLDGEKDFLHMCTAEVIRNASAEQQRGLSFTDQANSSA